MTSTLKSVIVSNLILLMMISCSKEPEKLAFTSYPDLKLGMTTQNFTDCLPVSYDNAIMLLDYAAEKGFSFVELRDPDAVLSYEECVKIAGHAIEKDIEVAYANQRGLFDPDFMEILKKGIKNATAFKGPRTIRATISGMNFTEDSTKKGLSREELAEAVDIANQAAQLAEAQGLQLVVENGSECFNDINDTIFGFTTFMEKVKPQIGWQFDTANPFTREDIFPGATQVQQYLEKNAGRIAYIHLKAAQDYEAQKVLGPSALDYKELFSVLAANQVDYISIELLVDPDLDAVYENMEQSVEFLKENSFIQ